MRRPEWVLAVALSGAIDLMLVTLTAAQAAPAPLPQLQLQPEPPRPPPPRSWYGLQTLAIDGVAIMAGIAVASFYETPGPDIGMLAFTWYGIGAVTAPSVHYARGRTDIGLADFGVRMVAPPLVGLLGIIIGCGFVDSDCESRAIWDVGTTVGLGAAAVVDAALFAWTRELDVDPLATPAWYGWQILMIDAVGYAAGIVAVSAGWREKDGDPVDPALGIWTFGYAVGGIGGPTAHFLRDRLGIGFLSFGARLIIGPIGALPGMLGYCLGSGHADDCIEHGAQWGLLGGAVAVSLFDAFALAHDPDAAPASPYALVPSIGPGSIGLSGYF